MPRRARRGEPLEIRIRIAHPMETGYRRCDEEALRHDDPGAARDAFRRRAQPRDALNQGRRSALEPQGRHGRSIVLRLSRRGRARMRGVAAGYPVFGADAAPPFSLTERIKVCRQQRQGAAALSPESDELPPSLERRPRGCMRSVRAEPFAFGAPEMVELELYLARRAAGMRIEAPAVRS